MFPRVKRLRAMQSNFDPVYPYDKEQFVISAPFVNTLKGLTTDPPGFIAIKAKPPLTFDNDGTLELVGGSNTVNVDSSKGLTKSNNLIQAKVADPIIFDSKGNITLEPTFLTPDESQGLKKDKGKLIVKIKTPLFFNADGEVTFDATKFASSFTVGHGLLFSANTITLQLSQPLQIDADGKLSLSLQSIINKNKGLDETNGQINLKIASPLTFNSIGQLTVDSNALAPNFSADETKGLELKNGKLSAKVSSPIVFDNGGDISVNLGLMLNPNSGLEVVGDKLALKLSSSLALDGNGALEVKPNTFAPQFTVDATKGLTLTNSSLAIKTTAPLTFDASGNLSLTVASPIIVDNGAITLDQSNTGPNFTVDATKGLVMSNGQLEAKVSSPIQFDVSGAISLNDSNYAKLNANNEFTTTQRMPSINFSIGSVGKHSNDRDLLIQSNASTVFAGETLILQSKIVAQNTNLNDLGGGIGLGWGSGNAYIVPEDNSDKSLKFSGYNGRGKFDLDMMQTSRIMNVKPPIADSDAVSKLYCDTNYVSKSSPTLGPVINLKQNGSTVPLVSFNNPTGTRLGYVGLGPTGSLDTYLQGANNVYLQSLKTDGQIIAKNKILYAGSDMCSLGNGIMFFKPSNNNYCYMGGANGNVYLRLAPPNTTSNRIVLIDLESKTRIMNTPDPRDLNDVISVGTLRKNGVYGMMWTGGRPTANCKANGVNGYNIRLGLTLSANGGMVNCSLFAEGVGPYVTFGGFGRPQVVIKLNFNSDGYLKSDCDLLATSWGYRQGENINQNIPVGVNLKAFMPNYLQYPPNTSLPRNNIIKKVYLDASLSFTTFIKLNNEPTGYSIWIVFDGVSDPGLTSRNFQIPTINFSYVGDFFNQS